VSGKNFVGPVERPVQPPQLLADFAPFIAMLQRPGDSRANPAGPLVGGIGGVVN